jgi:hypothetical protein
VNLFEQIAVGWQSLIRVIAAMRHAALWTPFAALALCELLVLLALVGFAHPLLSWFMAPLLRQAAGESALRYPDLFRSLPGLYAEADVFIGALVGAIVVGAATLMFADYFRGLKPSVSAGLSGAWRRSFALILASLPFNLVVFGLSHWSESWMATRGSGRLVQAIVYFLILGVSIVLQSLFFYVTSLIVLERKSVLGALAGLPDTWRRGFWSATFVGILLLTPLLPLHYLSDRADVIVDRGIPELTAWLVVAQGIVGLALWFMLAGSATLVYLSLVRREEEA